MLDRLFARFQSKDDTKEPETAALPKAVAALLVEAARGDEDYTDKERSLIDHILEEQFNLSTAEATSIRHEAEVAQDASNDLYGFSRIVKTELDYDGKCKLIEDMWVIALSDNESAPYEEMIIRRLIGLIYVEDSDSAKARQRAQQRLAESA